MSSPTRTSNTDHLKKLIREVPDFPKKGILFYDITTLLKDKTGFATLIDRLSEHYIAQEIDSSSAWRRADSSSLRHWRIA